MAGVATETQTCRTCNVDRPITDYGINRGKWRQVHCIDCARTKNAERARNRRATPEGRAQTMGQNLKRFNITVDQYNEMLKGQEYSCAICQRHISEFTKALAVDHDHSCCEGDRSCGKCIRGLLCAPCNHSLGLMHDNADRFIAAAFYLTKGVI